MPPISTDDIRQAYLDFFQSKSHTVIPGARLVPENDPTVLFTTAGMHPLVPYLIGEKHPGGNRLCDVQRCVRTQDIDEVGDASHLTMFEMLGNWSLGDYFKEEAITMSYEFLTDVLGIDKKMLSVTCFEGDNDAPKDTEAAGYWMNAGMPEDRIGFLPKKDNWWGPAGLTGPCGPDTEMFYWIGEGEPHGNPEVNDHEWLEIWNDVFMQYNKTESGQFEPLTQQNVDTGMGLERVAQVMQEVDNVYETDRMKPIMDRVQRLAPQSDVRHERIVTDHIKAATFIIADGVKPGNVDQSYVLRKIIRRAIRSAKQLGIETDGSFCAQISDEVVTQYGHIYGYIKEQEKMIADTLAQEEEQFGKTLLAGTKQLEKVMADTTGSIIAGTDAFHLYDTYGFPLELTREIVSEQGFTINEDDYDIAFKAHQDLSRKGSEQKFAGGLADHSVETTKLHTATHLLNAALRIVLGKHVFQKGSNITAERLRFDFSHSEKMSDEQKKEVEDIVNKAIDDDYPVSYHLTTPDKAMDEGAIGVFGEKYGDEVKVYSMGDFSKEVCGGPHVARTGMIGHFTLKKEESSSSGVRRIKAVISGGPDAIEVATEASS
ncbi:alanine--tRNA ligase [Candidatus Peregrinibacteria bacterium CG10_big_fil_rev_8_21_14_0_10_42_8]|nr:MAG: alanine--tRNA ligase [Candidatus Peregrinibacteria bacterium CG10_big_fil_rev_8_21_14_0_10_42_8]